MNRIQSQLMTSEQAHEANLTEWKALDEPTFLERSVVKVLKKAAFPLIAGEVLMRRWPMTPKSMLLYLREVRPELLVSLGQINGIMKKLDLDIDWIYLVVDNSTLRARLGNDFRQFLEDHYEAFDLTDDPAAGIKFNDLHHKYCAQEKDASLTADGVKLTPAQMKEYLTEAFDYRNTNGFHTLMLRPRSRPVPVSAPVPEAPLVELLYSVSVVGGKFVFGGPVRKEPVLDVHLPTPAPAPTPAPVPAPKVIPPARVHADHIVFAMRGMWLQRYLAANSDPIWEGYVSFAFRNKLSEDQVLVHEDFDAVLALYRGE